MYHTFWRIIKCRIYDNNPGVNFVTSFWDQESPDLDTAAGGGEVPSRNLKCRTLAILDWHQISKCSIYCDILLSISYTLRWLYLRILGYESNRKMACLRGLVSFGISSNLRFQPNSDCLIIGDTISWLEKDKTLSLRPLGCYLTSETTVPCRCRIRWWKLSPRAAPLRFYIRTEVLIVSGGWNKSFGPWDVRFTRDVWFGAPVDFHGQSRAFSFFLNVSKSMRQLYGLWYARMIWIWRFCSPYR